MTFGGFFPKHTPPPQVDGGKEEDLIIKWGQRNTETTTAEEELFPKIPVTSLTLSILSRSLPISSFQAPTEHTTSGQVYQTASS